jgi:hypothetical protein
VGVEFVLDSHSNIINFNQEIHNNSVIVSKICNPPNGFSLRSVLKPILFPGLWFILCG